MLSDDDRRRDYDARLLRGEATAATDDVDDDEDYDEDFDDDEDFDERWRLCRPKQGTRRTGPPMQDRIGPLRDAVSEAARAVRRLPSARSRLLSTVPVAAFAAARPSLVVLIAGWVLFLIGSGAKSNGIDLIAMAVFVLGVCGLIGHRRAMGVVAFSFVQVWPV